MGYLSLSNACLRVLRLHYVGHQMLVRIADGVISRAHAREITPSRPVMAWVSKPVSAATVPIQRSARIKAARLWRTSSALLCHTNGCGFSFEPVIQVRIEATSFFVERWLSRCSQRSVSSANYRSTRLSQEL